MAMKQRDTQKLARERLQLLEAEAALQRASLAVTLGSLQKHRVIAWGGQAASWGARLLATPRIRWLIAAGILSRIRRRWRA
jgi:hypothetical protein